jgi:MinD-like ATPase involved in chromosome partitioning or flagellar assembly
VDLPTYTNIWRIEKRLYKLYDFRLPAPLPITWIAVFVGITVPYIFFLVVIGLPFNHNLVWLYVLPPGVLTWLCTRPVIENKRLPELVSSQLRYLSEPRTWCRMAPFAEKDEIHVSVRVWHRHPPGARPRKARKATGRARSAGRALEPAAVQAAEPVVVLSRSRLLPVVAPAPDLAGPVPVVAPAPAPARPVPVVAPAPAPARPLPVPERAPARSGVVRRRPAWAVPPSTRRQDARTLEVSHDPEPDPRDLGEAGPAPALLSWPEAGAGGFPQTAAFPEAGPFPEAGAFPEAGPFPEVGAFPEAGPFPEAGAFPEAGTFPEAGPFPEVGAFPEAGPFPEAEALAEPAAPPAPPAAAAAPVPEADAEPGPAPESGVVLELEPLPGPDPAPTAKRGLRSYHRSSPDPAAASPRTSASPGRSVAAKVANLFVDLDGDRPVPSVERALSGPGSLDDASWRRRVKVVTGGQGPGQQDQEALDRNRARLPLPGPRRIAVLGCTSGAGQSAIALMTGHTLAAARAVPVAVLDLNPGEGSLAALIAPATSVTALLAGHGPGPEPGDDSGAAQTLARYGRGRSRGRVDIVAGDSTRALGPEDYQRLSGLLAERYPLTMIDPAPSGLIRLLALADQLVLVTPASPEAATALAHTQQWLSAHGHDGLAARAVTVVNGVSRRSMEDVLAAESVARGRCRAIVRVPWDDQLSAGAQSPAALHPQTRLACTALAGVLVASLIPKTSSVAEPGTPPARPLARVRGRSSGEHAD